MDIPTDWQGVAQRRKNDTIKVLPLHLPSTDGKWPPKYGGRPWPDERGPLNRRGRVGWEIKYMVYYYIVYTTTELSIIIYYYYK